jgi:hypothetical protein
LFLRRALRHYSTYLHEFPSSSARKLASNKAPQKRAQVGTPHTGTGHSFSAATREKATPKKRVEISVHVGSGHAMMDADARGDADALRCGFLSRFAS